MDTTAQKYKADLALRTDEQETDSPLWEQPPYTDCHFIHGTPGGPVDVGELAVQFEDGSVYDYETNEAYTKAGWAKFLADAAEIEQIEKDSHGDKEGNR
jgi:hypothetical protein